MRIEIVQSDIFAIQVDAIVNPANRQGTLWLGSHISETIRKRGGRAVRRERREKGRLRLGEAVATTAGELPFRFIIHAAVLDVFDLNPLFLLRLRQRTSDSTLREAVRNSLAVAEELRIESLAFSPMGAGIGAMPVEQCARIMFNETLAHAERFPTGSLQRAVFAVLTQRACQMFRNVLEDLGPS